MNEHEEFKKAYDAYPSQDNEGFVPDRGGFKCGFGAAWNLLSKEIERLKAILAQEASDNDDLGAEYVLVQSLRAQLADAREAAEVWRRVATEIKASRPGTNDLLKATNVSSSLDTSFAIGSVGHAAENAVFCASGTKDDKPCSTCWTRLKSFITLPPHRCDFYPCLACGVLRSDETEKVCVHGHDDGDCLECHPKPHSAKVSIPVCGKPLPSCTCDERVSEDPPCAVHAEKDFQPAPREMKEAAAKTLRAAKVCPECHGTKKVTYVHEQRMTKVRACSACTGSECKDA